MAAVSIAAAILSNLLFLRPWTATSNILAPVLPPILDDVCKGIKCGKGNCKASVSSTFFFVCECEPGWKQTRPHHDTYFNFLPCVIPNCTMDLSCMEAAPPGQDKGNQANTSFFDTCNWSTCGGGTCNKISPFAYNCECKEGYYNLLKIGSFPCFRDCALGMDCAGLGISVMNNSSPTSLTDSVTNHGSFLLHANISWMIAGMMILVPVIWKSN